MELLKICLSVLGLAVPIVLWMLNAIRQELKEIRLELGTEKEHRVRVETILDGLPCKNGKACNG